MGVCAYAIGLVPLCVGEMYECACVSESYNTCFLLPYKGKSLTSVNVCVCVCVCE